MTEVMTAVRVYVPAELGAGIVSVNDPKGEALCPCMLSATTIHRRDPKAV